MSDETTRDFLNRRERELGQQIAALEVQIMIRKEELEEIALFKSRLHAADSQRETEIFDYAAAKVSPYEHMTIKELVVQALKDSFEHGATNHDLREFIRSAYGRTIEPSSLRPQLSRMTSEGVIQRDSTAELWFLSPDEKRRQRWYGTAPQALISKKD
jgi:hypothetical protein